MSLQILHEDNHLIAINKPAGWLVQADQTGDTTLADYVKRYIKDRYDKPGDVFLGTIHRLDRPVSGVVVFARTSKALTRMNELFRKREIEKTYWAVVGERPQPISGTLKHLIKKDSKRNFAKIWDRPTKSSEGAKEAELSYKLIAGIGQQHLLEVKPKTGRPHQIRVQLAALGTPIRGDLKYGYPEPNDDASIHLHATALDFIHPVKREPVHIEAPLPEEQIWNLFRDIEEVPNY